MFVCNLCFAITCTEPEKVNFDIAKYDALIKRAAYASFLAEECHIVNDIDKLNESFHAYALSNGYVSKSIFREKRRFFKNDSNIWSVFKRCYLIKSETVAFIDEVESALKNAMRWTMESTGKYNQKNSEFKNCQAQKNQEEIDKANESLRISLLSSDENARKQAVTNLRVGFRNSMNSDYSGTAVLRLINNEPYTAEFRLRCYTTSGKYSDFNFVIPSGEEKELGYLQGWDGNFVSGEYCEAYYKNEFQWKITKR